MPYATALIFSPLLVCVIVAAIVEAVRIAIREVRS
jgi:hypothetical protein